MNTCVFCHSDTLLDIEERKEAKITWNKKDFMLMDAIKTIKICTLTECSHEN